MTDIPLLTTDPATHPTDVLGDAGVGPTDGPPPADAVPAPPTATVTTGTSSSTVTVSTPTAGSGTSSWDHFSAVMAALILTGSGILDSFHSLTATDWTMVGVAVAALGLKGTIGGVPRS